MTASLNRPDPTRAFSLVAQRLRAATGVLGYVPLPASLVQQVLGYWARTFNVGP